jgi:hypothetical protein
LISPTAIVSQTASTYQTVNLALDETLCGGALDMGDTDVESAWRAFHSAWASEITAAGKALDELASLVPKSVQAFQNTDARGGQTIYREMNGSPRSFAAHGGTVGQGASGASGPSGISASSSGATTGADGNSPGGITRGRARAE